MADETQQPANGNAASDTSALDTNQAAAVFAQLLTPDEPVKEEQKDEPAKVEAEKPQPDAEGAEVEGDKPAEKMFTVKDLDGNDIQISESELINGYKAQKASTQKFEAAAALRKEAEAQSNQARQERATAAQAIQQAQAVLGAALQEQQKIDWHALRESDPVEFLKQQHLFSERQAALQQNQQRLSQLSEIEAAERDKAFSSHLQSERQALLDKFPAWKDEAKAKEEHAAIAKFLVSEMGYKAEQIFEQRDAQGRLVQPGITDHRAIVMAREAMLYREMMSKASAAAKKVGNLPQKVERPGVADSNQALDKRGSEWQKFAKSGKVEDAAAIFSRIL